MQSIKLKILDEYKKSNESLEKCIDKILFQTNLSTNDIIRLKDEIYNEIEWYGKLTDLLKDDSITEIMVNGKDNVFIERGGQIEKSEITFDSEEQLISIAQKIASEVRREINLSSPILDARLKDGSRVNVITTPVSKIGTVITIRKFKRSFTTLSQLVNVGMLNENLSKLLSKLVKCKYNIFICGGTGSGKTTVLNCLANEIPKSERVITIEDAAEIDLSGLEHVVTLETKNSKNSENNIGIKDLIKNSLRMRPDRIIVGEVRGEEVVDMLQAMNTGHEGSFSTGHSNSAMEMLTRLEVIASNYSGMGGELLRRQIVSAIDIIIQVERLPNGKREITNVFELEKKDDYSLHSIYSEGKEIQSLHNSYKLDKYIKYFS